MAADFDIKPSSLEWKDYMRQNMVVREWMVRVKGLLRQSARQFVRGKQAKGITRSGKGGGVPKKGRSRTEYKLAQTFSGRVLYKHNISEGVSYRFERHGVFVHKGVGRGYQMQGGMVVRTAKSPYPNPRPRVPVDWFNSILDNNVPELADRVGQINADAAINAARMRIN